MLIDISPLRHNTAFRRLFASLLGLVHVVRALGRATVRRMGTESDPALGPRTSAGTERFKV